jgi:Mn2+/Fe2+ NRAMP family transporter
LQENGGGQFFQRAARRFRPNTPPPRVAGVIGHEYPGPQTYVACVGLAAAIGLIPGAPLRLIILGVQVLAGIMLPSAIIFLRLLLNDKEVLGDEYINKGWNDWVNWTVIVLFILSLFLAAQVIAPNLFPAS